MTPLEPMTVDEVKALHAEQVARKDPPAGWDPRQATRVQVHATLLERNPMPYSSVTPEMLAARSRREPLTYREKAADTAHQRAQVSDDHHAAFQKARAEGHVDVLGGQTSGRAVADAHHYAQKLHGKALWAETDRLVAAAVGEAVRS